MRKISSILFTVMLTGIMLTSFGDTYSENETITLGQQVWMVKNLNVDTFRNGDPIPQVTSAKDWKKAGNNEQPAWCYYDNDSTNGNKYGRLYNWYAVTDPRGLAPDGWHIPSDSEWTALVKFLGEENAGHKMKSSTGWMENGNGSNESGFSGLPGGYRNEKGVFMHIGGPGNWWSSSQAANLRSWSVHLFSDLNGTLIDIYDKRSGFSVRCLKD
jgi:uncharacterized protein (TIGR02145 family)